MQHFFATITRRIASSAMRKCTYKRWTAAEDRALLDSVALVRSMGIGRKGISFWKEVAKMAAWPKDGDSAARRDSKSCRSRYALHKMGARSRPAKYAKRQAKAAAVAVELCLLCTETLDDDMFSEDETRSPGENSTTAASPCQNTVASDAFLLEDSGGVAMNVESWDDLFPGLVEQAASPLHSPWLRLTTGRFAVDSPRFSGEAPSIAPVAVDVALHPQRGSFDGLSSVPDALRLGPEGY